MATLSPLGYDTLTEWQSSARLANAAILGFSAGAGSSWGLFVSAVDNIGWTINDQSQIMHGHASALSTAETYEIPTDVPGFNAMPSMAGSCPTNGFPTLGQHSQAR